MARAGGVSDICEAEDEDGIASKISAKQMFYHYAISSVSYPLTFLTP